MMNDESKSGVKKHRIILDHLKDKAWSFNARKNRK